MPQYFSQNLENRLNAIIHSLQLKPKIPTKLDVMPICHAFLYPSEMCQIFLGHPVGMRPGRERLLSVLHCLSFLVTVECAWGTCRVFMWREGQICINTLGLSAPTKPGNGYQSINSSSGRAWRYYQTCIDTTMLHNADLSSATQKFSLPNPSVRDASEDNLNTANNTSTWGTGLRRRNEINVRSRNRA